MYIDCSLTPASPNASPLPPLSVLYVLGAFPVLSETFISNEIRAMRAHGHRVVPLALAPFDGACQPDDEPFKAETLALADVPKVQAMLAAVASPARLLAALQFAKQQHGIPARSLLLAGARTALMARQHGCTHIHAHFALPAAATAIMAAKLSGLTSSFMAHGYDVYGTPADLAAKLRHADIALASCDTMRDDFLIMEPEARVGTVLCGINPERFVPAPGIARNGRLLAVGRLVHQKGYDVLLAALAALPPSQRPVIDAVGGGELAPQLLRDAAALGVTGSINFLGPRPGNWIAAEGPAYLGFVAPYCLAPDGDRDTGPLVVREAMAMGLPVVASDLMGLTQTVTSATGRLVPPRDIPALAGALRWLAEMPEEQRVRMGAAGRARVEAHFTIDGQAASLAAAIRSVRP